jgi:acyl carrier protein
MTKSPPPNNTIEAKARQIVCNELGIDEGEVTLSASFADDLCADSLDQVELIMSFEEAFDIEIPDEKAEAIKTFGDAVEYLKKRYQPLK